ncbi:MAG: glutamate formiminotransferase / 5-formyltetrahydrofolate cyclo-ligase [Solirubrobacteraceae bacterium]|jgi:glutamate formiminotransferase/glutamate formiminotransferase/formiminotetrahydrofolate cyclodeaminase|nr:glutamate formiminotransferase / 5-formyltetrahydrofolate cyclo-ligase [Solirubrobacteraceae bacterium]
MLVAVPNVSEGRDAAVLDAIGAAFAAGGARVLDRHADPDHDRAVFTLAALPGELAGALVSGAREAIARIDLAGHDGLHPHVGAVDVAPIVFREPGQRGAAVAEALVLADRLGDELGVPVFLYGALGGGRTRAELRAGGPAGLAARMAGGLRPDFGPPAPHPTAGATLVAARAPLVAFNLELAAPATVEDARRIAAAIRESGSEGLPGLRAIGLALAARDGVAQISCNVEDPAALPLAALLETVERHASVAEAELVGLAPRAAFDGWPARVAIRNRATLEDRLTS